MLAISQRSANQEVAFIQIHRDNAGLARITEVVERRLLDGAQAGCHEDVMVFRESAILAGHWQHDSNFFAILQREHVDDRLAARIARTLRYLPHLQPIQTAAIGKAQNVIVRVGDE